jgi:hypothetical protein
VREELLPSAMERFKRAWSRFYNTLRKAGLRSGLATYHVKKSTKWGWHYHCHLVAEFDGSRTEEDRRATLDAKWKEVTEAGRDLDKQKDLWMRVVCGPGDAFVGMAENTQLDFWSEPADEVEKVLHYVVRDVLQGVEGWTESLKERGDVFEFCDFMGRAKRHRCYGKWRKPVAGDATEGEVENEEKQCESTKAALAAKTSLSEWTVVSTMDHCLTTLKRGESGSKPLLMQLIGCTNRAKGCMYRLRKVVSAIAA